MIKQGVPLKDLTWYKIGGEAEHFAEPSTDEEVLEALRFARQNNLAVTVLGQGTNVLISDRGIQGLVISTRKLNRLETRIEDDRFIILAEAGVLKSQLAKLFLSESLIPAVFLSGIPGDVGGGIAMNAGLGQDRRPREFSEIVDSIEVVDMADTEFTTRHLAHDQLTWSYRRTSGFRPGFILRAELSWPHEPSSEVKSLLKEQSQLRRQSQPLEYPSCGSVFKNPLHSKLKSGQLIEQAGLKGLKIGGAQISEKHANFIINLGDAKAQDVYDLIQKVRQIVRSQFQVDLEPEVELLGEFG